MTGEQSKFVILRAKLRFIVDKTVMPDWEAIPLYQRPKAALDFAKEQSKVAQEVADGALKLLDNIDKRLKLLEAAHGEQKPH